MIANARMYSVSAEAAALWGRLLSAIIDKAGVPMSVIEHPYPKPMEALWRRTDLGAVFMCGLPFSRATPQPAIVAAPVPSPPEFGGAARYFSEFVVRADSRFHTVEDTFGTRIAFTAADSQSGCVAALTYFMSTGGIVPGARAALSDTADTAAATDGGPLYREVTAPTMTPLGAVTAVIEAAADVAPIDAYALRLLRRYRPELTSQVRIVGRTSPTPIPPLVASDSVADTLRSAFQEAHRDVALRSLMEPLLLQRFVLPEAASYGVLRDGFESATRYWSQHRFADSMPDAFVTNRG
jgi:ABC-type phosphate/phosphonate transport system substrate-binding protein